MNTPNKLTIGRIIATPFFMAALMIDFPYHYTVALILFIAASLTDMIDGKMARKYNMITDFGKFLDPLADKMLTTAAFLGFIKMDIGWQVTWIAFIVLFREFLISSLRLVVVSSGGKVIAANIWGKYNICAGSICAYNRFSRRKRSICYRVRYNYQYSFLDIRRIMYYIGYHKSA